MRPNKDAALEVAKIYLLGVLLLLILLTISSDADAQSRTEIETVIRTTAERHGVDADLAVAIAVVESGLDPSAMGGLGEVGIFQLRPEFHTVIVGDYKANTEVAIQYLVKLRDDCRSYGQAFFVCFNTGPNKRLRYPTLFPYYVKVMRVKQKLAAR